MQGLVLGEHEYQRSSRLLQRAVGAIVARMSACMPRPERSSGKRKILSFRRSSWNDQRGKDARVDRDRSRQDCLHVFENEYPADGRPRKALEAAEKWLHEPTIENRRLLEKLETQIWRSKEWHGQAGSAAQACGCAARAARHPVTSAMDAIWCEGYANGINRREYSRKWLYSVLRQNVRAL
jgi:hypothetical protein